MNIYLIEGTRNSPHSVRSLQSGQIGNHHYADREADFVLDVMERLTHSMHVSCELIQSVLIKDIRANCYVAYATINLQWENPYEDISRLFQNHSSIEIGIFVPVGGMP